MNDLIKKVETWGEEKGIVDPSNADKQFMKFMEEVFEFKTLLDLEIINFVGNGGYIKFDDTKMEFGDVLVTLVILPSNWGSTGKSVYPWPMTRSRTARARPSTAFS